MARTDRGSAGKSSRRRHWHPRRRHWPPRRRHWPPRRRHWQHGRMPIPASSIAHVRLTVTDIERSRQFYESVFGWQVLIESPESANEATRKALGFLFGGVIYDLGGV